eukprot:362836-Chlamydomonas_euryale.AAC.14
MCMPTMPREHGAACHSKKLEHHSAAAVKWGTLLDARHTCSITHAGMTALRAYRSHASGAMTCPPEAQDISSHLRRISENSLCGPLAGPELVRNTTSRPGDAVGPTLRRARRANSLSAVCRQETRASRYARVLHLRVGLVTPHIQEENRRASASEPQDLYAQRGGGGGEAPALG